MNSKYKVLKYNFSEFKNVEDLHKYELLSIGLCDQDYKIKDYEIILKKFYKFWKKLME